MMHFEIRLQVKEVSKIKEENYVPSPIFPENYLVGDKGTIMNKHTGLIRKLRITWDGYYDIGLHHKGKSKTVRVHRLVALAFVENPHKRNLVHHKDGNKLNNCFENLEWSTVQENTQHAYDTGLEKPIIGSNHGRSKYKEVQIQIVCDLLEQGELTRKDISKSTDVSLRTIQSIQAGENWSHISEGYALKPKHKSLYSETTIIEICNLLQNTQMTHKEIAKLTGVSQGTISQVSSGTTWTHISNNFKFPKHKTRKYQKEQVMQVCELLEGKIETQKQISKMSGIPLSTVKDIKKRKGYNDISDRYNF